MQKIIEIYRYRELLKNLVVNELKLRYRRSVLGFLWTMLNPLLMMVVLTVVFCLFPCGFAFLFSCANVFFRDFTHMTEVLITAWFYVSPIIYRVDMVPEEYRGVFAWNPMLYVIECFRIPLFDGRLPPAGTV